MAAVPVPTGRVQQRRHWSPEVRLELIETDADTFDNRIEGLHKKLDRLNSRALGLLFSTVTATVLLALNLVVK